MSKQAFMRAMNHIDDQTLERYEKVRKRFTGHRRYWIAWTAAAACLVLIVSIFAMLAPPTHDSSDSGPVYNPSLSVPFFEIPPSTPSFSTSPYSAQQIADLLPIYDSLATNAYTKVPVSSPEYLYLTGLPEQEYLPVYTYLSNSSNLDASQFETLLQPISNRLVQALGSGDLPYEIREKVSQLSSKTTLEARGENEQYHFYAAQFANHHCICFNKGYGLSPQIILNGETVQIDQRQTDEQIIASLSGIKQSLFEIFGESFTHVKIVRDFSDYDEYGAKWISIYFYNENDHPLNQVLERPVSDYIWISFDNVENFKGDYVSDSVLCDATIYYYKYRTNIRSQYEVTAKVKLISLEEAETLLCKGYVFGGHTCPLCMQAQEKVDFEDYNYVSFTYVFGHEEHFPNYPTTGIPFYVFYKQIGTARNGNKIYAKTYVPAIAIDDLEEYFASQEKDHK